MLNNNMAGHQETLPCIFINSTSCAQPRHSVPSKQPVLHDGCMMNAACVSWSADASTQQSVAAILAQHLLHTLLCTSKVNTSTATPAAQHSSSYWLNIPCLSGTCVYTTVNSLKHISVQTPYGHHTCSAQRNMQCQGGLYAAVAAVSFKFAARCTVSALHISLYPSQAAPRFLSVPLSTSLCSQLINET